MSATISLRLPDELRARVTALAAHVGKSAHAFMLYAIERQTGLAENRRSLVDDALAAKRDMALSG